MNYAKHLTTATQREQLNDRQIKNNAGGYVYSVDDWTQLERFLILGSEGGTYYVSERKLTKQNAKIVNKLLDQDSRRVVDLIVDISQQGRAPKNDPAIFALSLVACHNQAKRYLKDALPKVCRTGTHLFMFVDFVNEMRSWGRCIREAVSNWYNEKTENDLAWQLTKYQNRNGWSHRDVFRMCHIRPKNEEFDNLIGWSCGKKETNNRLIEGIQRVKSAASTKDVAGLIREYGLVREHIPTEHLNSVEVWDALLEKMPMTAMIRNLGKMTAIGLAKPLSQATSQIVSQLENAEELKRARIHPVNVLSALKTYGNGRGFKGSLQWNPVDQIVAALDSCFYKSFDYVEPTGKNYLLGIDISGSMRMDYNTGTLSAAEIAAAMAMTTARTEKNVHIVGFSSQLIDLGISSRDSLAEVLKKTSRHNFGHTDCAAPMIYAQDNKLDVDVFNVYTDNETWYGNIHPSQAIKNYRKSSGRQAKSIVLATATTNCTIADPLDPLSLDICGFDSSIPELIRPHVMQ